MNRPHGKFTPSQFSDAMKNGRGKDAGLGTTAITLCKKIAMERLGVAPLELSLPALEWGNEWEGVARQEYEKIKMVSVEMIHEPIQHPDKNNVAGTPDGFIGKEGLIEIKCPHNPQNHFLNLYEGSQLELYKWQGQGYLWITGREWFDFVSYDPRFSEQYNIKIIRVERDNEMIDQLSERIELLESIVVEILKNLKQ